MWCIEFIGWSLTLVTLLTYAAEFGRTESIFSCELKWELSSLGRIPATAVPVDLESIEYIGRGKHLGSWKLGRLRRNQSFQLFDETIAVNRVHEFASYEVLVNPLGCQMEWIQALSHPFQVSTIGRTLFGGKWVLGTVTKYDLLRFVHDGEIYERDHYQILTSIYPKMHALVQNITFNMPSGVLEAGSHKKVIGLSHLESKEADSSLQTTSITHKKLIQETFTVQLEFLADTISQLTFHLDSWYNTETYLIEFDESDNIGDHTYKHVRDTLISLSTEVSAENRSLRLCSTATIFNGQMPFEALINFPGNEYLSKDLLGRFNITVFEKAIETKNHAVFGRIKGTLSGSFVIATGSELSSNP